MSKSSSIVPQGITCLIIFTTFSFLAGCESYDFTVNDKLVYSPAPLFSDFDTPDRALYDCIKQAIIDTGITDPGQLKNLNCSHAGIENLQGLAIFTGLTQLKLSSNKIRNLVELSAITNLEELYLENNTVIDPVPLYLLHSLRRVNLRQNPGLQCPGSSAFPNIEALKLPDHCG